MQMTLKPPLQASSSPVPILRIWPILRLQGISCKTTCKNLRKKARNVCFSSTIAIGNPVLTNRHCCRHTVNKPPPGLLQFKTMSKRFPWHLVILLGSGFALAEACKVTAIYTG